MADIRRLPISYTKRLQNRLGPNAVQCLVTERWLRFGKKADRLADGDYVSVDVMKLRDDEGLELGASRKLASLIISRQDLERALGHVQWPDDHQTETPKPEAPMEDQVNAIVDAAVERLGQISEDAYFRDAVMKAALREICHKFAELGVSRDDIADHLDVMADVMRDLAREDRT